MSNQKCRVCGDPGSDDDCAKRRQAFWREPFLSPCFMLGAQWYSFDNGLTWTNNPLAVEQISQCDVTMTVVNIDQHKGEITVKVNNEPR